MKRTKAKIIAKIACWLAAEIILTLIGIDNLADYSEFVFDRHVIIEHVA